MAKVDRERVRYLVADCGKHGTVDALNQVLDYVEELESRIAKLEAKVKP